MRSSTTPSLHMSSSFWTTHRATNGSTSRFHFRTYAPSYLLQYVFWQDKWGPLCLKFITLWPWLTTWLVFLVFQFFSPIFFPQRFRCNLDYHILQLKLSFDVCAHISSTLWVSISYVMFMAMNAWGSMTQFTTFLLPLHEMLVSMWDKNNYMHLLQPHSTHLINESTLCSPKMEFAP
jgi:hypothetical protein